MPIINLQEEIILTAGGGTVNLDVLSTSALYVITGTATLTSNWTIQPSGTPLIGTTFIFSYEANIDLDGNDITIFGETLPTNLSDKSHKIEATWDGSNWEVKILADVSVSGSIPINSLESMDFITMPSTSSGELMSNGKLVPVVSTGTSAGVTYLGSFKARANANSNILEVVGHYNFTLDETSIVGDMTGNLFGISLLEPVQGFQLPVRVGVYDLSGLGIYPVSYVDGVIHYTSSNPFVRLSVLNSELGALTNARYFGYINLKLPY